MSKVQRVKSAARVLDIFELLRDEGRPLTLTEMSRRLQVPMSSLHSLVHTLASRGYLEKDEVTLSYQLGPAIIALARDKRERMDLIEAADTDLAELSQASGESVSLAVLEGQEVVIVNKKVSNQVVRVVNPVGTRLPAHATALGKCILANLKEQELIELYPSEELPTATSNAVTTRTELLEVVDQVRATRLAYDREESALGLFAVGSPIFDYSGDVVGAVSIAAPAARATVQNIRHWEEMILPCSARIGAKMGYRDSAERAPTCTSSVGVAD